MTTKTSKEWKIKCPWGEIAIVSWGDPSKPPVLLAQGYMDTVLTFLPLLDKLPDDYYYVAFDFPGQGKSDPFPGTLLPTQLQLVEALRLVVRHLNWDKFVFIAHSMGFLIGLYYNTVFPGRICKMINLDPAGPLGFYVVSTNFKIWFPLTGAAYYNNYHKYNPKESLTYTFDEVVNTVARSRNLTEEQAAIIVPRMLEPSGQGKYRMTFDQKMKKLTSTPLSQEIYLQMLTKNVPPMLHILDKDSKKSTIWESGRKLLEQAKENLFIEYVSGGHDLHITNPDEVSWHVIEFLNRDFNVSLVSKL